MTALAAAPVALPPCPGCHGGGEINGLTCRECGGAKRAGIRRRRDWRALAGRLATPAGIAVGKALNWSRTLPGIGGAAAVTFGLSATAHAIWHWLPGYAVAALAAGMFGLMMDRRL